MTLGMAQGWQFWPVLIVAARESVNKIVEHARFFSVIPMDRLMKIGFFLATPTQRILVCCIFFMLLSSAGFAQSIAVEATDFLIKPGRQVLEIPVTRTGDFPDGVFSCQWKLNRMQSEVDSGSIVLDFASASTMRMALPLTFSEDLFDVDYFLHLDFFTPRQEPCGSADLLLYSPDWEKHFILRLRDMRKDDSLTIYGDAHTVKIDHRDYTFHIPSATDSLFLHTRQRNVRLITGGFYLEDTTTRDLFPLHLQERRIDPVDANQEISSIYAVLRDGESVLVKIDMLVSPYGFIDFRCTLLADFSERYGLSMVVPGTLQTLAVFGKTNQSGHPWYTTVDLHDFNTPMAVAHHRLSAFLDRQNYGIGIMMLDGQSCFSTKNDEWLVTFPLFAAGQEHSVQFRILPVIRGEPQRLFGPLVD
jgi:hypothetical protein